MSEIERRLAQYKLEYREESYGRKISGLAVPFASLSQNLGGFREVVEPGAFDGADLSDICCLFNHDPNRVLGRSFNGKGTLEWRITGRGLEVTVWLPETELGNEAWQLTKRGDIKNFSFAFTVAEESYERRDGGLVRHIWRFKKIYEVSLVVWPAYPSTFAQVSERALAELRTMREFEQLSNDLKLNKMNIFNYFLDQPDARKQQIARQMAKFYNNNAYAFTGSGDYRPLPWMNPQTRDLTPPADSVGVSAWQILREGGVFNNLGITFQSDIPNSAIQLPVPNIDSAAGLNWPGLNGAAQEAISTIGGTQVSGKRVAGQIVFSSLLYYADEKQRFSNILIDLLKNLYQNAVEKTFFSDSGDSSTPQGLLYGCTSTEFFVSTGAVSAEMIEALMNATSVTYLSDYEIVTPAALITELSGTIQLTNALKWILALAKSAIVVWSRRTSGAKNSKKCTKPQLPKNIG